MAATTTATYSLEINIGDYLLDKLFRVCKNTSLVFRPGPQFIALDVDFKTNYPLKKGSKFERSTYTQLAIQNDHQDLISSSFNWQAVIELELSGTYHFVLSSGSKTIWEAYIIVLPELKVPLESIRCQTVLSKNLGPLSSWRKRLGVSKEARYNMIHFTPIQELGASNSAYSIRQQHKVNPSFKATLADIKKEVEYMEKKWGVLSATDIVLNHTADDSDWIREHPECSYNVADSPHLRPAFLLDSALIWFMQELTSGLLLKTDKLSPLIDSDHTVNTIGMLLKTYYIPQLKIYELFMVDINHSVANFDTLKRSENLEVDYGKYERNKARVVAIPSHIDSIPALRKFLQQANLAKMKEIKSYLDQAINNVMNAIRYERLDPDGPYRGLEVSPERPLVAPYFTHSPISDFKIAKEEALMYSTGQLFMAHNGWVMGCASSDDQFGEPSSHVYLKRELIAWGDCIKLRYGKNPADVPYLWDHIRKYVESQAKIFHGFRIDNCHSTPLHVAEFVLDVARAIRPDIFVMAELFTSSESVDNIYVNRLGITCLVREAMSASNCRELGRLMYRYGGTPVGAFFAQGAEPLKPGVAHAIFYDQTHDNESPIVKRSAYDLPATSAILNMASCATGSNRGYDELVPHHINVVTETRLYSETVDEQSGLMPLRRFLNGPLLRELQKFTEIFVDQRNEDVVAITRHNPIDGRSIVLVARTAFSKHIGPCPMEPLNIEGYVSRILIEAQAYGEPDHYTRDSNIINGLDQFKVKIFNQLAAPGEAKLVQIEHKNTENRCNLSFNEFKFLPSSVLAFEICLSDKQSAALKILNDWQVDLTQFELTLDDASFILFRCAEEDGWAPYSLPEFCKFTYSGLYGLMYHLAKVRENHDQAHPLVVNLRSGNWLSDYIVNRLRSRQSTMALADHLDQALKQLDVLPRGMVPKYFDFTISKVYNSILDLIYSKMSVFVSKGPRFVKLLALSSVALVGVCDSAPLPSLECSSLSYLPSIAAGLPHFASGYMRNWGRDTFIALRGLLLVTGRYAEAKAVILSCARTLKNGLIPNLIDGGVNSRYNCRDAVWWWLYCIREYTRMAPNGNEILRCKVNRIHKPQLFGRRPDASSNKQNLHDLIQEAMECHFRGTEYVEEQQQDEHMKEQGFRVKIGVSGETGFVFGGNEYNCGTWMDKMGSSLKAGTKGKPASPRDGSAIEIVGLCKAVVSWLENASKANLYPYDGVETLYDNTITLKWTWKKWASLIQANFEKHFFIPKLNGSPSVNDPHPQLINRRGIYKDTLGATQKWQDYQFRPNLLVAMVVAPELFDRDHAAQCLELIKTTLCGPLGMKTLDPTDWNYCGTYDNGDDSCEAKTAHGFNYHQGPEWLWLTGYYIRASSRFLGASERSHHLQLLSNMYSKLISNPWLGLPELTNENGKHCKDSCEIQAWSLGTTLEALHESIRIK